MLAAAEDEDDVAVTVVATAIGSFASSSVTAAVVAIGVFLLARGAGEAKLSCIAMPELTGEAGAGRLTLAGEGTIFFCSRSVDNLWIQAK